MLYAAMLSFVYPNLLEWNPCEFSRNALSGTCLNAMKASPGWPLLM